MGRFYQFLKSTILGGLLVLLPLGLLVAITVTRQVCHETRLPCAESCREHFLPKVALGLGVAAQHFHFAHRRGPVLASIGQNLLRDQVCPVLRRFTAFISTDLAHNGDGPSLVALGIDLGGIRLLVAEYDLRGFEAELATDNRRRCVPN